MSQGSQTAGGFAKLLSGIQETVNNHLEDLYADEKMKLSSDLGEHREGWDWEIM